MKKRSFAWIPVSFMVMGVLLIGLMMTLKVRPVFMSKKGIMNPLSEPKKTVRASAESGHLTMPLGPKEKEAAKEVLVKTAQPTFNTTPDLRCRALGRVATNLYRCGENLILLKEGVSFPENLKSLPWSEALASLKSLGLMADSLSTKSGDITLSAAPNDPKFPDQASINASAAYDIGVEDVWNSFTGDPSLAVAITDSGIDSSHPDLQGNLWINTAEIPNNNIDDDGNGYIDDSYGFNFAASTADVRDDIGHGSHAAGVIGAVGNNGIGISGINWNVKLMALKITDASGKASLAAAIEAINYAIANHARVINASWVMDLSTPSQVDILRSAIQNAINAGAVVAAAAGNGFENGGKNIDSAPLYPASLGLPGLISVASVEPDATLSAFSNFGATSVDLAAPGSGILSTTLEGNYGIAAGTSVAASVVSGASALLLAAKPSLSPADVKALFMNSVKPETGLTGKVMSGGTLNLRGALAAAGISVTSTTDAAPKPEVATKSESKAPSSGGCSLNASR